MNLRFSSVVVRALPYSLFYAIPKANHMIKNKEQYSYEERCDFAYKIMDYMRKQSRTITKVFGRENIPEESPFILYSNHQGKYDALGILTALGKSCGVLWEERQAKKIMGRQVCGLIDGVPIDLTDMRAKVKAISKVTEQIKAGQNMLIFPEGGYNNNGNNLQEFQAGCFQCALRSQAPIVPVTIFDSFRAMNGNTFEKVTTQVHFLPPISFEKYGRMSKQEICEMVKNQIAGKLREICPAD